MNIIREYIRVLLPEAMRGESSRELWETWGKIVEVYARSNGAQAVELGEMLLPQDPDDPGWALGIRHQWKRMKETVRLVRELVDMPIPSAGESSLGLLNAAQPLADEAITMLHNFSVPSSENGILGRDDMIAFVRKMRSAIRSAKLIVSENPAGLARIAQSENLRGSGWKKGKVSPESYREDYEWLKQWAGA